MSRSKKINRAWYIIDAKDKILGRLSSVIARYLIGKHKVEYSPDIDVGDYIIVLNSKKVHISGQKFENKIYYKHTGYIGGIKSSTFRQMVSVHPERVVEIAVRGMLPKNSLGRMMYRRLRVYSGSTHNHEAQLPKILDNSKI